MWLLAASTVPSVLLQRQGRPSAALSWMFALFALPPFALLAWWLFGRTHLSRRRRRRRRAARELAASLRSVRRQVAGPKSAARRLVAAVNLPPVLEEVVFPPSGGNRARLITDTQAVFAARLEAIREASDHLHLLYYIWRDDPVGRRFRDLLVERARRGVKVRVLYDGIGSALLPRGFFRPLIQAGGRAECFLPLTFLSTRPMLNFRNHRKILIADGRVGFTGGINIGQEYLRWRDLEVRIQGPGVDQLQEIFVDDWYFACRENLSGSGCFGRWEAQPSGDGVEDVSCATVASGPDQRFNAIREMLFLAITDCRRRLWITTPYLVPDGAFSMVLRSAAYRGVDVRIMVPAESDVPVVRRASRVFYPDLMDAGVRIHEYQGMLHAKTILFDEDLLLIGSANMDTRSFRLNFEASTFLFSSELNAQLAERFLDDLKGCKEVNAADLISRTWSQRVVDSAAHLLSPLL